MPGIACVPSIELSLQPLGCKTRVSIEFFGYFQRECIESVYTSQGREGRSKKGALLSSDLNPFEVIFPCPKPV